MNPLLNISTSYQLQAETTQSSAAISRGALCVNEGTGTGALIKPVKDCGRRPSFFVTSSYDFLLRLVTQPLLVAVELHALAALVLGNFGFAFLFNGSHRSCISAVLDYLRRKLGLEF
jgi:hypothetical protein